MRHYFLDTNVVVDYLAQRAPFWPDAAELMQAGLDGQARLYVASLSFTNIYYTLRKATTAAIARALVEKLAQLVEIVGVDAGVVQQALASSFTDFEDGVQHFSAMSVPVITAIVTRDLRDFSTSFLPVLSPAEALAELIKAR
jgi:predicted nucleic acid-binding protein